MSSSPVADQSASSVFDGLGELLRDLREDLLPRIPWRAATLWGVALGATFVIRAVYDILEPTADWAIRSAWSTWAGLAICFCAGFHGAWRGKDFGHGGAVLMLAILAAPSAQWARRLLSEPFLAVALLDEKNCRAAWQPYWNERIVRSSMATDDRPATRRAQRRAEHHVTEVVAVVVQS